MFKFKSIFQYSYQTQLNCRLADNEKYRDFIRSCMELRVEYMYKLV